MSTPLFSVITPVYNRESLIADVISSVLSQQYENWEFILVDDGSTDHTGEICKEYAQKDARIVYIHQENRGVSAARNVGLNRAQGDWIVFLDSDNSLKAEMLLRLSAWIEDRSDADIICFGFDTKSKAWQPCESADRVIDASEILKNYLPEHINIRPQKDCFLLNYIWNKCFRRSFLVENDICFDESRRTWEDGVLVVNALASASSVLLISDVLYNASCDIEVDHLSSKMFENQIQHYIADETDFKNRFEHLYDFSSAHYCRSNFNVVSMLFSKAVHTFGTGAKGMIEQALNEEILQYWAAHITPADVFERNLQAYIQRRAAEQIFVLYRPGVLGRIMRTIARHLQQ